MAVGALFGCLNTMYAAVAARGREIATLRALGYGAFPVAVSVMLEAAALSVAGALIGAAMAWALYDGVEGGFGTSVFKLTVSPAMIGMAVLWAIAVALLGGLLPSIRAARRPVVEALTRQHEMHHMSWAITMTADKSCLAGFPEDRARAGAKRPALTLCCTAAAGIAAAWRGRRRARLVFLAGQPRAGACDHRQPPKAAGRQRYQPGRFRLCGGAAQGHAVGQDPGQGHGSQFRGRPEGPARRYRRAVG